MYHFTNYRYAMEAAFNFNPEHPTSLLYEKHGDDYKLIGVMYTAPKRLSEDATRPAGSAQRRAMARARELLRRACRIAEKNAWRRIRSLV